MGALFPFWGLTEAQYRIRADLSGVRALQANLRTEAEVGKLRAETFVAMVNAGVPANMAAAAAQVPLKDIPGGDAPRTAQATAPPAAKAARNPRMERKAADPVAARLARMDEWTDEARKRVAALLVEQGNAVAAAYASGKPWDTALSMDDWEALMRAIHTAVLEAEGAVAFTGLLAATTAAGGGGAFDVLADNVVEWIDDHVGTLVKGIDETSRVAVAAQIKQGVEAGESQRDIAKRLRSLHEDWSDYRAATVARTEVAAAFGQAHQASAEQIAERHDVQLVKVWLATRDSRTRDEHAAIDGERVALDEAFSIGVQAPPGGVNCRCVVLYSEE
jgi:SPP1 gp7 family putative phage head morphogenesis protein